MNEQIEILELNLATKEIDYQRRHRQWALKMAKSRLENVIYYKNMVREVEQQYYAQAREAAAEVKRLRENLYLAKEAEELMGSFERAAENRAEATEAQLAEARQEIKTVRDVLKEIAEDPHCQYYHPEVGGGEYGKGVSDGHRCAARKARIALDQALAEKGAEDEHRG